MAVLAAANFLADRYNKSFDSTKNKRYSLSDQTAKVAGNLKQDVTITYFDRGHRVSRAPRPAGPLRQALPEAQGRLRRSRQEAPAGQAVRRARHWAPSTSRSAPRREEAKSLTEEEVTGALIRALKSGERNVCFVSGSGERTIDDTGPQRPRPHERGAREEQLQDAHHLSAREARDAEGLHGPDRRRAHAGLSQPAKWTRSRRTSRTAGARCSCWIRR